MALKKHTLLIILLTGLVLSCEEVIQVDLNRASPEIVIEAIIQKDSTSTVRITRTTSYFDHGQAGLVSDANVVISNDDGDSELLLYQESGYYKGNIIRGTEGTMYEIEILYEGILYSGQSYMPPATDTILLEQKMLSIHGRPESEQMYELECKFTDRPDISDYYLVRFIQNDILLNDFYTLASDFASVDDTITYSAGMYFFEPGDSVEINIYSVDENLYNYFSQLNDATRGMSMFSTPYNPKTNIEHATLGYFAAWSYTSAHIIID